MPRRRRPTFRQPMKCARLPVAEMTLNGLASSMVCGAPSSGTRYRIAHPSGSPVSVSGVNVATTFICARSCSIRTS